MKISRLSKSEDGQNLQMPTGPIELKRIAKSDPDYRQRIRAIRYISDDDFLNDIAYNDSNRNVQKAATTKITAMQYIEGIAKNHTDCHVRAEAIGKIDDIETLENIAQDESSKKSGFRKIEPPHPKRGWGFLNYFHLIMVNLSIFSGYPR